MSDPLHEEASDALSLSEHARKNRALWEVQTKPRLTILSTGQVIFLTGGHAIIGRSDPHRPTGPAVDLSALDTDRMVSRRQARVLQHDGRFFVEDLRAFNATRLNGVPLRPNEECELHEGDVLRAGNVELRFSIQDTG